MYIYIKGDGPPDVERSRSYALFPAAIYSAIPLLIQLLDDAFVGDGTNTTGSYSEVINCTQLMLEAILFILLNCFPLVAEAAQHVIWKCLVEEPSLFFRPYQERAIKSGEQVLVCLFVYSVYIKSSVQINTSGCYSPVNSSPSSFLSYSSSYSSSLHLQPHDGCHHVLHKWQREGKGKQSRDFVDCSVCHVASCAKC